MLLQAEIYNFSKFIAFCWINNQRRFSSKISSSESCCAVEYFSRLKNGNRIFWKKNLFYLFYQFQNTCSWIIFFKSLAFQYRILHWSYLSPWKNYVPVRIHTKQKPISTFFNSLVLCLERTPATTVSKKLWKYYIMHLTFH